MSTATFKVNPITVPPLECPKVILPTKGDLVNMFSQLANLPAQLIVAGQEETAKQIQDILDEVRSLLSIYDPKFEGISIPEIEWEIMITRLVQDYPMYVQQKLLELISKLVPINFTIPVLGLSIDILKIFTPEGIADIKKQLTKIEELANFFKTNYPSIKIKVILIKCNSFHYQKIFALSLLVLDQDLLK